jgi:uncharacterized membrane protein
MISRFINKIKVIEAREFFILLMATLFLLDVIIILNIPWFREILSFIYFTIVPGMLIFLIFKLNKIKFLKKFLLWVGSSVSLLILVGLFLNSLYPLVLEPLSLLPTLLSLNIILIALSFIAYQRNKNEFNIEDIFNFKFDSKNRLKWPTVFPILFPLITILGTYLMNTQGNNIILLLLLFLIPLYILVLAYLRDRIPVTTYPIALWMIGMSLLLLPGLSSNHLMGRDIHKEFYCFQLTLNSFHWSLSSFLDAFNACLSITILPTVYQVLSNINSEYVFKLFYALIGSITPLICYAIFRDHLGNKYGFFASLLIIFMAFYIASMGSVRQLIALVFFFLSVMVIFDKKIDGLPKKVFALLFMVSIVLSHYTTAYISFVLLVPILALPFLKSLYNRLLKGVNNLKFTNFWIIIPFLAFVSIWYLLVAQVQIEGGAYVIDQTSQSLQGGGFLAQGNKDDMILAMFGVGLKSVPNMISAVVHDTAFFMILVGLLTLIWSYKSGKPKLNDKFIMGIFISLFLLALLVILPRISIHYPAERVFIQALVFLAPLFVIGVNQFSKIIKKPKSNLLILAILLIALFSCNTYITYHVYGIPYSPYYENSGDLRGEYYIHDQEVIGAEWLKNYSLNNKNLSSDLPAVNELLLGRYNYTKIKVINNTLINSSDFNGYIYLRYVNINGGMVYININNITSINDYKPAFLSSSLIYNDGGAKIFYKNSGSS